MDNPKVLISCGTKFHSDHVSFQLQKHQLLQKAITSHPSGRYLNRVQLLKKNVTFLPPIFVIPYLLKKIPTIGNYLARLIEYRLPPIFDYMASWFTRGANISITWSWAGLYTMRKIKAKNGITILEESGSCNLYQNELLAEEYNTLGLKFSSRTPDFITKREMIEAAEADYILCPSNYVAESFIKKGIRPEKFFIIPYGVGLANFAPLYQQNETFTILFVGTIGVRKGLIYLFKALELLKTYAPVECVLVGPVEQEFMPVFKKYHHLFTHAGRMPQTELVKFYNNASVFVFPSLDEGMALVQLEAMACGLPVITTTNAGADAVITDGLDGFIIPIRDPAAITNKIKVLYDSKELRDNMAINAANKAKMFTWDSYGERLSAFINQL